MPASFGSDPERDAGALAAHAAGVVAPWPIVQAMARATGIAHVGLATPSSKQGMRALNSGRPLSVPGFSVYPLADGPFAVFDVIKGASADRAGLRIGDVLVRAGGERMTHQVPALLPLATLPAGSGVPLAIERAGRPLAITLRLLDTDIPSLESRLLADATAYVRIRWFAHSDDPQRDTAALARRAFESLAAQGARGLVLDLRSALGGAGEERIASALSDGEVIYYTRQPPGTAVEPVKREGRRTWPQRPIAVLVNEQTISSGEALALALRELASAKIIGRTTSGGLTEFSFKPLADGYALVIPTAVVVGPVSRSDQPGHAVHPDVDMPNPTVDELVRGRDRQLDAARAWLLSAQSATH
ncbi:MAG TPA: S41 family peptidase [Dokdonella sp.]